MSGWPSGLASPSRAEQVADGCQGHASEIRAEYGQHEQRQVPAHVEAALVGMPELGPQHHQGRALQQRRVRRQMASPQVTATTPPSRGCGSPVALGDQIVGLIGLEERHADQVEHLLAQRLIAATSPPKRPASRHAISTPMLNRTIPASIETAPERQQEERVEDEHARGR